MRRTRWIWRHEAAVSCPDGRWGRRRTRTNECWAVLRAEDVYTSLLKRDARSVCPSAHGGATYAIEGHEFSFQWEVRQNGVWRRGRVFLRCPRCSLRCTRLYMPLEDSWVACRRCWGLTYASRTLQNYKESLWGRGALARMFGTTQRDWAFSATYDNRKERRQKSRNRWAQRRRYLKRARALTAT